LEQSLTENLEVSLNTNYELEYVTDEILIKEILTEEEIAALDKLKEQNAELCEGREDRFLMLFIWARKLEVERAVELLKNHLQLRKKLDLDNINMQWVKELLSQEISYGPQIAGVDSFDAKKRLLSFILPINMIKLPNMGQDKQMVNKMAHYAWWTIEKVFYQKKYIRCFREGVVYLEDFKDVSVFKMTSAIDRNTIKEMMETMQDGLPLRIRMIYLYNFPVWLRVLIAIVKPFMKKKLRKKSKSSPPNKSCSLSFLKNICFLSLVEN